MQPAATQSAKEVSAPFSRSAESVIAAMEEIMGEDACELNYEEAPGTPLQEWSVHEYSLAPSSPQEGSS